MARADGPSSGDKSPRSTATTSKLIGPLTRRGLLASAAYLITTAGVSARVITKVLPWRPNEVYPVTPVGPGGYLFFTPAEAASVDAIVDRLIPTDDLGPVREFQQNCPRAIPSQPGALMHSDGSAPLT